MTPMTQPSRPVVASLPRGSGDTYNAIWWARLFFLTPIPSILAIHYAIRALHPPASADRRKAVAVLGFSLAALIGWWKAWDAYQYMRGSSQLVRCQSNIRSLSASLYLYAESNDGRYPPSLNHLVSTKLIRPLEVYCPTSGLPEPVPGHASPTDQVRTSYVLLTPGLPIRKFGPDDVVIVDLSPHYRARVVAIFGDGHGQALPTDRAAIEVARTLEKVRRLQATTRPTTGLTTP